MIVKMIILRLLGSSDDKEKEKIGVARPKGPPLRGFRYPVSGRGSRGFLTLFMSIKKSLRDNQKKLKTLMLSRI